MRKLIGMVLLQSVVLLACAPPPCEQPLSAYCDAGSCTSYVDIASGLSPFDAGASCPSITVTTCEGGRHLVGFSGSTASVRYFERDAGLVGVWQSGDIAFECGPRLTNSSRTFGTPFDCPGSTPEIYCYERR